MWLALGYVFFIYKAKMKKLTLKKLLKKWVII